jgi:hypothetical protein
MSDTTREEWLNAAIAQFRPWFADQGKPLPDKLRVTCGFTSTRALAGAKNQRIGECWYSPCSADGTTELIVSITLAEPVSTLAILAHELCHAALPIGVGHKGPFKQLATAIGLEGKMTATVAGPLFKQRAAEIIEAIGPYPHGALNAAAQRKKQSTRMIKCTCPECGYTARTTRQWLEVGPPHCPDHGEMEVA